MFHWIPFLTYAVITAVTPGPNNLMSMSNAAQLGFRRALPFNLGIWVGFSAVMSLCTLFCGLLSAAIPKIKTPMLAVGAAYMLWLAWSTWRSGSELGEGRAQAGFLSGLFLQFVNPKIYIYCIVSMEAYILPYYSHEPLVLFGFAMLLALIGFLFTLCWSGFGSAFRALFSRYGKVTNRIMALLLVWCAVSLFL